MESEDGGGFGVKRAATLDFSIGGMPAMSRILRNTKFILQKVFVTKRGMMRTYHAIKTVSSSITIVTKSYDLSG